MDAEQFRMYEERWARFVEFERALGATPPTRLDEAVSLGIGLSNAAVALFPREFLERIGAEGDAEVRETWARLRRGLAGRQAGHPALSGEKPPSAS